VGINDQTEHVVILTYDHDGDLYEVTLHDMSDGHWSGNWACGEKRGPVCGDLCRNSKTKKAILHATWQENGELFEVSFVLRAVEGD
jgi:hypothetical protein